MAVVKLSGWGIVQVVPYGLHPPPPVMHFLRVLIQDIHNLPLLFVFPEVFARWLLTPGDGKGWELGAGLRTACYTNWSVKRITNMVNLTISCNAKMLGAEFLAAIAY